MLKQTGGAHKYFCNDFFIFIFFYYFVELLVPSISDFG